MPRVVSQSAFAKMAGVSRGAVTQALDGRLKPAAVGRRVDADHPAAIEYLQNQQTTPIEMTPEERDMFEKWAPGTPQTASDIARVKNKSIVEVVKQHGTQFQYFEWLKALKLIEDVTTSKLKNEQTTRGLISRELVEGHVMGLIDASWRKLLTDSAKNIAHRTHSLVKSGAEPEELEAAVREILSSQLKALKTKAIKTLKNA
jgi:hypothetical protein